MSIWVHEYSSYALAFWYLMKLRVIRRRISTSLSRSFAFKYLKFSAIINWVSISESELNATYRNWTYSFRDDLAAPSATLLGKDTAALLICALKP